MQFITIKESSYTADLFILKSKLESERLECRIKDELSNQVLYMSAKLQVAENDFEKAKEILMKSGEKFTDDKIIICPKCNSEKVKVKFSLKNIFKVFSVIFKKFITFSDNIFKSVDYICKNCNYSFSNK